MTPVRPRACRLQIRRHAAGRLCAGASVLAWSLACAGAAFATANPTAPVGSIYTCRDSAGRTYTSDRPIPECAGTTLRELRRDGSVRREIAAPLTPEQLRRREVEEQRRLAEEAARRERTQRDRALLMAYPTEARLEQQRARALDGLHREIEDATQRMLARDREMKAARARLAAQTRGAPAAAELAQQIEQIAAAILVDDAIVRSKRDEIARVQARFDEELARLRQLLGGASAAASGAAAGPDSPGLLRTAAPGR